MKSENSETGGLRTWLEIDRARLAHNYAVFRSLLGPETKLMAVAKSNAYGHDIYQFARLQQELGADYIGVDSIVEATALRETGITIPLLVLGYTLPEKFAEAVAHDIALTISSLENLELLKSFPELRFHLKIDSGMHRQGFLPEQVQKVLETLKRDKVTTENFEGIYTHFAAAKNPAFPAETLAQLNSFLQVVERVKQAGYSPIRHAAATSGTIVFPESQLDLVRIGIGMYGLYPSREVQAGYADKLDLKPALTWKTVVSEMKDLPAGSKLGYDLTEKLAQDGKIAIAPVGYWHGYPRALSSIGHTIINDEKAKVLGRVSMDMLILDVSEIKSARVGDEVILLGGNISAEELGDLSETSSYEIVTRLNPLMKRVYN